MNFTIGFNLCRDLYVGYLVVAQEADELARCGGKGYILQPGCTDASGRYLFNRFDFMQPALFQIIEDKIPDDAGNSEVIPCKMRQQIHVAQFKIGSDGNGILSEVLIDIQP